MSEHPLRLTKEIADTFRMFYRAAHEYEMGRYDHSIDLIKSLITRIESMHINKNKINLVKPN